MQSIRYKVWTSLTEPIVIKGITLDYGMFLIVSAAIINTLSFNRVYLSVTYFILAYIFGVIKGRSDRNWFRVVLILVRS